MKKEERQSVDEILEEKIEKVQRRQEWSRFLVECVVIVAAVYLVFHYCIGLAFVSGHSMEPSLTDGELAIFYRMDSAYQPGDIVIIHRQENVEYIKRIVAESGDVLELTEDGVLLVNGEEESGCMTVGQTLPASEGVEFPYTVPENCYFVLGDNRENSQDSRVFGAVRQEEITGRVFFHLGMVHSIDKSMCVLVD